MKTIEERYAFATRIPIGAFTIEKNGLYYTATCSVLGLPSAFCSISQVCVSNGKLIDVFDEFMLSHAELQEKQIQSIKKMAPCRNCN